jgi:hypothetical protein
LQSRSKSRKEKKKKINSTINLFFLTSVSSSLGLHHSIFFFSKRPLMFFDLALSGEVAARSKDLPGKRIE